MHEYITKSIFKVCFKALTLRFFYIKLALNKNFMVSNWTQIKLRALNFSQKWANASAEEADLKAFLFDFFNVFGISKRKFSTFKLGRTEKNSFDLFWKGTLLVEIKKDNKNPDLIFQQTKKYLENLSQKELPKGILISDYSTFWLYHIKQNKTIEFSLTTIMGNVQHFEFILPPQKATNIVFPIRKTQLKGYENLNISTTLPKFIDVTAKGADIKGKPKNAMEIPNRPIKPKGNSNDKGPNR
jgi:hypothetical protein